VLAKAHGAEAYDATAELLADAGVGVVVVATPPSTHAVIAATALESGKHVFCEKPLATEPRQLQALAEAARVEGRVLVVDHVLRYNPLLAALTRLQEELLGRPYRFLFENDAGDEELSEDHWFWDDRRSGGIFVEHGVHFFDAAAMLLGRPAASVAATVAHRPDGPVDLVSATVRHGDDALATHTHSFTHARRCERQLMRLDYGTAEARVDGWIPVDATVDLWTDDHGVEVCESLPDRVPSLMAMDGYRLGSSASVDASIRRDAGPATARGRGVRLDIPHHVRLTMTLGGPDAKADVYAESVRAAMSDLLRCVRTGARPTSGLDEGAAAVGLGLAAGRAAALGSTVDLTGEPS
jgi:predicted dehydrogenase